MPQTPSFFIPRGLSLYNRLAGQRFSLRSGAASATQPVGRPQRMVLHPEIVIEYFNESVPLDVWGTFRGYQWDFWGKHGNWEFRLSETADVLPEAMAPDEGFALNGTYPHSGEWPAALSGPDAEAIIKDCFNQYLAARQS